MSFVSQLSASFFAQMSHRDAGGPVQNCMSSAADKLRALLDVPANYHVLFMQGGAHGQVSPCKERNAP